jgi:hypothetical protein
MAISEAWLKAQLGKDREKIEEFADRDAMSVRITPKGKIVLTPLNFKVETPLVNN